MDAHPVHDALRGRALTPVKLRGIALDEPKCLNVEKVDAAISV